ncbi:MAG TPA: PBP1A family penicillin-binding protein [Gemmatimonadales bacterium]|nr:PBP1A family penicillin-binding protein [Gemmatimonadales bacterium]
MPSRFSSRTRTPKAPRPKKSRSPWVRRLLVAVLALVALGLGGLAAAWYSVCAGDSCPAIAGLDEYDPDQASKVYAADGRLITDLGLQRRTVVPLQEMAPAVKAAFIATEDKRFYEHHGIDWVRAFGAVKNRLLKGRLEGFSTITMQLAGNLWPEDINRRDRSLRRKLKEMYVASEIERKYSKDKILELYLNQINLGNRAFGVEAASQRYFGKSVRALNVAEAATLAALPKAPERYNPRKHPNYAVMRRNVVLGLLRDDGKLSAAEAEKWKAFPLLLSSRDDFSSVAQYFVEYVRQQLDQKFGRDLYTKGYRVYTTLDLDMQQTAERALETQLEAIESGTKYGPFPHKSYRQIQDARADAGEEDGGAALTPYLQGLLVTLEAKTGYIRALVGGRDFDDSKFNRATQSRRQPGSTFKPLVYSAALRAGYPLSTIEVDSPLVVEAPGQAPWTPKNFDAKFDGPHTLRHSLMWSRNVPTIKLGMQLGEPAVIEEARRYGLTTPISPVPSIHIGAADVIPLEMISAYTAFANLGERSVPTAILRVEDRKGNIVWQPSVQLQPVMSPEQAWLMNSVLQDVVRSGTASGAVGRYFPLVPIGGKTGTTNDGFDVWFIGYTPELVTGVWMGFDQPQKIKGNAQGGILAAPAWTAMMREVYDRRPNPAPWPRPEALTFAEIDQTTGYKATPFCPREVHYIESFIPGTEPVAFCPVHSPFGVMGGTSVPGQPGAAGALPGALPGMPAGVTGQASAGAATPPQAQPPAPAGAPR